jgi:Tol biopolymer transport system component/tRNA A-37 threonylcarbamoyl transferase component Bud32
MGEVYRARDTRLGRDVAVKVLPKHLSSNSEVRARFEREAKTVSSLNHPHICTLFDVGREGDTDYLVMELVEGETLATRLVKGALPTAELLKIGSEIADALDRAHRAGVVHRDLKPGNVMLTKNGAKLMDFGLARVTGLAGPAGSGVSIGTLTQSPTVAHPLTAEGTLVGTFQYMAPEQLEGKEADARSDLWAMGCVLYEMATGRRAFEGKSQASLITSIMGAQPAPVSQVAPATPAGLDRLVQACLAKDPADRVQSAHDVKLQLSWMADAGSQAGAPKPTMARRRGGNALAWSIAAVAVAVAAGAIVFAKKPATGSPPVYAYLQPPRGVLFSSSTDRPLPLAVSPDGSALAFCARDGEGSDLLWVRSLGNDDARPIPGTEGAQGPFFSPDGRSLGFFTGNELKRVDVAGGPVITLARGIDQRGGTWNRDGLILFTGDSYGPVSVVPADGGPITAATALDSTQGETTHRYPFFLPDGRHFLYLARRAGAGAGENPTIYVGQLGSDTRKAVLEVASNVAYASGHLIYIRGGVLVAQRFDVGSLAVDGPAVPLVDDARMDTRFSRGVFAVSHNGVLICMTGRDQTRTQLRWLDRAGKPLADVGEPADYTYGGTPRISPDGKGAVMPIANADRGVSDVWIVDLETGRRRKVTVDTSDHPAAQWLPDSRSVVVSTNSTRSQNSIDAIQSDGTQRALLHKDDFLWPESIAGDRMLYSFELPGNQSGIYLASLSGNTPPEPFIDTPAFEQGAQFSPDGRFVAYVSDETGRNEVFVAAFPQPGGRWQASQSGGMEPRWNRNGRELFFVDPNNYIVSLELEMDASGFRAGAARQLFQWHGAAGQWRYDVAPDGNRFLVAAALEEDLARPVTIVTDWTRKLENR